MYQVYKHKEAFKLECGVTLNGLEIAYHSYGHLDSDKNNVVWACQALTGNSDVVEWWPCLVGEGWVINPQDHFIICLIEIHL